MNLHFDRFQLFESLLCLKGALFKALYNFAFCDFVNLLAGCAIYKGTSYIIPLPSCMEFVKKCIFSLAFFILYIIIFCTLPKELYRSSGFVVYECTGCFFSSHWYPPTKLKYGKPMLGESSLT